MEDIKLLEKIEDIRQSEQWAKYLQQLGWKSVRTSKGINVEILPTVFGSLIKIQRPPFLREKDLEEIKNLSRKTLLIKVEPCLGQDEKLLKKHGYKKSASPLLPPSTIFINLKKAQDTLWNSISRSGKYSIQRAQREGAKVEFHKNPGKEKLESFHKLFKKMGGKKGMYVQNLADLKTKANIFGNEALLLEVYKKTGELAGANFYLGYKNNVWFMHGFTTEEGRKGKEGYELVWQSFLYFKNLGYNFLDLEGKDDERFPNFTKNWGGFSHFKEKFGGTVVKFPYPYIKYTNPVLKRLASLTPLTL